MRRKIVVIGLDGADFHLIKSLINQEQLPTLSHLIKNGSFGLLKSTIPPLTCPAWFSFSTGKNPGRLGMYNFYQMKKGTYEIKQFTNLDVVNESELWDILNENGLKCGVVNNPIAYPPKKINGYMVSGFLAPSKKADYTYPADFKKKIDKITNGYEIDASCGERKSDQMIIDACHRVLKKRRKLFLNLLNDEKSPDFFLGVFTGTDRICHQLLNKVYSSDPKISQWARGEINRFFKKVDRAISEILKVLDKNDLFIIMSDHGFCRRNKGFYINQWLINNGYLRIKARKSSLEKIGLTQRGVGRLAERLGIKQFVLSHKPKLFEKIIPKGAIEGKGGSIIDLIERDLIDWKNTKAIAIPGGIYINTEDKPQGIVNRHEYEILRDEIVSKLKNVKDPKTGKRINIDIFKPEDIYQGDKIDQAPDIVYVIENYHWGDIRNIPERNILVDDLYSAHHREDGIVLFYGPGIIKKGEMIKANIIDLAPTILHLMDIPIPKDMDGEIIKEILC